MATRRADRRAPSRACSPSSAGKPLARAPRRARPRHAPDLARAGARYATGLMAEGVHVIDAGEVGTEMLYFLVGSREPRRRADLHRLAQPQGYTGAKLVARGRDRRCRASGHRATCGARSRRARPRAAAAVSGARGGRAVREFRAACIRFIDPDDRSRAPAAVVARRRQRDGRADGRPAARATGPRPRRDLLDARRQVPRPRAEPAARRRTATSSSSKVAERAPNRDRLGRRRRPLLLHRRHGRVHRRRLHDRAARRALLRKSPGATILYDVRATRAVADTVAGDGGTPINRVGHAFFKTRMRDGGLAVRRRGLRALLLPRLLLRGLGHDPGAARCSRCSRARASACPSCSRRYREEYFISGEINSEVAEPAGEDGGDRRALLGRASSRRSTAFRSTTTIGTSTSAPRTPSRCCACASSRSSRARTWSAAATRCWR